MGYGLRPTGSLGGGYTSGGFNEYRMVDGETDDIFQGDFMMWEDNGYVAKLGGETGLSPASTDDTTTTLGVVIGFRWVDASGDQKFTNWYQGNASNTKCYAYIVDDPNQLFVVESDGLGATAVQADVGQNVPAIVFASSSGNTTSGVSGMQVDISSAAVTATLGLRIMGIVQDGANELRSGTQTSNLIVKINANSHSFGTGVAVAHG